MRSTLALQAGAQLLSSSHSAGRVVLGVVVFVVLLAFLLVVVYITQQASLWSGNSISVLAWIAVWQCFLLSWPCMTAPKLL